MGFKENINQTMWGNPDDVKYLDFESWQLYAPYKPTWNTTESNAHVSTENNFRDLMYKKDLPPEIDETICPWGINKNSGIGNIKLMSGYGDTPVIVPVGVNTPKGQKPMYFTFNNSNLDYSEVTITAFSNTLGYLESVKDNFNSTSNPPPAYGYSFVMNTNLKNMFVAPMLVVADDVSAINNSKNTKVLVHDYFTRSSNGVPLTEKYPYILGVYAGLYYRTQAPSVIPNIYTSVQSQASSELLDQYPELNTGSINFMTIPDANQIKGTGSSSVSPRNVPTWICVAGHTVADYIVSENRTLAWVVQSGGYPNARNITSLEEAVEQALDPTKHGGSSWYTKYYSYIMPDELNNKLKTGLVTHQTSQRVGAAWYENLTEEEIYRQIAYLGLPFYNGDMTYTEMTEYITNNDFTADNFRHTLMYPDFSSNMITTGTYQPYTSSESPVKNTDWLFNIEKDYDPNYVQKDDEDGEYEKKQSDRGDLQTTYHNNASMSGFTAYVLSGKGLESVKTIINAALVPPTDMSVDDWLKTDWYGQDPASFILAVNKFPCDIQQIGGSEQITIGRTRLTSNNTPLYAATPRSQLQQLNFGTLKITPYYNNFLDYAPYSNYTLHIPYLPDYTLDPKIWLNHTCTVKIDYDIVTCNAMAEVWRDDMWYDTIYGIFGSPVPFLAYNTGGYQNAVVNAQANVDSAKNAMTQSFLSTATSVVSTGVGIATGNVPLTIGGTVGLINTATQPFDNYRREQNAEYNLKHIAPNSTSTSSVGGVTTLITRNYCTLIISRPQPLHYNKTMYGKTIGFACCETGTLNNYHGLTICNNTRFNNFKGTQSELAEIQKILNTGVILP